VGLPDLPLLAGFLLGLSLAAPPGPVTALMASAAARRGPGASLGIGLGATTADATFLVLAVAGAIGVLAERPLLLGAVSLAGALLLAYFAWGAWRAARAARSEPTAGPSEAAKRTGFAAGYLAAITSPFNLAWWVGPGSVLIASVGLVLVAGLFAGILSWILFFSVAVARLGRRVRRFQEYVAYASALVLGAFAVWVAWRGLALLGALPA